MMPASSPRLVLSDLLTPAHVAVRLKASDREGVFRELIQCIPGLAAVAQESLLVAVLERERLHSTGIGDGVALPHARNALAGLVEQPVVVFGRHAEGIPFGAIDNLPCRLFFLLVAPNVSQHLQLLARLSRMLRDARLRLGLLAAESPQAVLALIREADSQT